MTGADWFAERLAELDVTVVDPTDPNDDEGLPHLVRKLGSDVVVVDHYGIGEVRSAVNAAGAALVSLEGGARSAGERPTWWWIPGSIPGRVPMTVPVSCYAARVTPRSVNRYCGLGGCAPNASPSPDGHPRWWSCSAAARCGGRR